MCFFLRESLLDFPQIISHFLVCNPFLNLIYHASLNNKGMLILVT